MHKEILEVRNMNNKDDFRDDELNARRGIIMMAD